MNDEDQMVALAEDEQRQRAERAAELAAMLTDDLIAQATTPELDAERRRLNHELGRSQPRLWGISKAEAESRLDTATRKLPAYVETIKAQVSKEVRESPNGPHPATLVSLQAALMAAKREPAFKKALSESIAVDEIHITEEDLRAKRSRHRKALDQRRADIAREIATRRMTPREAA